MWYETEITIPAGRAKATPTIVILPITFGVIHRVVIEARPGCDWKAAIRILYHEFQIYPLNSDSDIALDAIPREFDDRQEIFSAPYELKITGYSPDASYDHVYRIGIGMMYPESFPEYQQNQSLLSKIGKLLGVKS